MAQAEGVRRGSLVFPILLIAFGAIFLYANWHPAFDPWPVVSTYWPLLLILVGFGMFWDTLRQRGDTAPKSHFPLGSTFGVLLFVLALAALLWHGRAFSRAEAARSSSAISRHESRTVNSEGAKMVHMAIEMPSGQLTLTGGADHLLDGEFSHSASWEAPKVAYSVSNGSGELKISQDGGGTHFGTSGNNWNLKVKNDLPIDLKVNLGAGQGNLRMGGVDLTRLELNIGAGEFNVDLTGDRKKDLQADINGGVGQANIRLPKNVGVVVSASGLIGSIDTHGLKRDDGRYTNDAYGKSPATIHLTVQGAIGSIKLVQEP